MRRIAVLLVLMGCTTMDDNEDGVMPGIKSIEQELPIEGHCMPNECGEGCPASPIILDVAGNGFALTDVVGGVTFDLVSGGAPEQTAWTVAGSDDSWLALDRNANGTIDDGAELFGNFTEQPESQLKNGYLALDVFDLNHDGRIGPADAVYSQLRLWRDENHDGVSQPTELSTLASKGILALSTQYEARRRVDEHGNLFRYTAPVYRASNSTVNPRSFDVFLITAGWDQKAEEAFLSGASYLVAPIACPPATVAARYDCFLKPAPWILKTDTQTPLFCADPLDTRATMHSWDEGWAYGPWPKATLAIANYTGPATTAALPTTLIQEMNDARVGCDTYRMGGARGAVCVRTDSHGNMTGSLVEPHFNASNYGPVKLNVLTYLANRPWALDP